ncbi:MAG TPA: hypothetical protein VHW00_12950 [Thermoanaerobaculia bacterium]|nr:hypothetical protein [Thermoanaerobaculia bacterium]
MKRHLALAAAALFALLAFPAMADNWGTAGSTGFIDESSSALYEVQDATLRFKSGQTGTIVARYPIHGSALDDPNWQTLVFSYGGPGVSVKLVSVYSCGGGTEQLVSWGPSTTTASSACENIDVSNVYWDTYGLSYYLEVTLTRTSTSTNPQFLQAQLQY